MGNSITVVVGPPCAGKSTHVFSSALDGDVVVDFDCIAGSIGASSSHGCDGAIRDVALIMRRSAIDAVLGGIDAAAWIIHTSPSADDVARYVDADASFVLIDPGAAVCLERASADGRPEGTIEAIMAWYYAPPALPVGVDVALSRLLNALRSAARTGGGLKG